mgnify:CR=1 FL=1
MIKTMKKMLILVLTLSLPFAFDAGTKSVGGGVNFVTDIILAIMDPRIRKGVMGGG